MSASRAIASARNRKAGGNYPSPTVPSQQAPTSNTSTASVPPQQPVAPPKLSIPQVFEMMERRLGTLEDFMQNSGDIMESVTSFNEDTKQKYIVDADVFQSIVDRIEALETGKTVTQNTQDSLATHVPNEQLQAALSEIDVLKDTIIQLQTFVMETHKKLSDIVFSPPAVNDIVTDYTNIFHDATGINTNNIDPNTIKPPTLVREIAYIEQAVEYIKVKVHWCNSHYKRRATIQ